MKNDKEMLRIIESTLGKEVGFFDGYMVPRNIVGFEVEKVDSLLFVDKVMVTIYGECSQFRFFTYVNRRGGKYV